MKNRLHLVLLTLFTDFMPCRGFAEMRTFTSTVGTTIRGELVAVKGDRVTIKKDNGQTITVKASGFSRVDQAYLEEHGIKSAGAATKPIPPKPAADIKPQKTVFPSCTSKSLDRFAWKGKHVALLSASDVLDPKMMSAVVRAMDEIYEFYVAATGREPVLEKGDLNRAVTLEDESLSGLLTASPFSAIIIVRPDLFRDLCRDLSGGSELCNQNTNTWFWMFGVNHWHLESKVSIQRGPNGSAQSVFRSGFCDLMALLAAQHLGLRLDPGHSSKGRDRSTIVEGFLDAYVASPSLNYQNTLGVQRAPDFVTSSISTYSTSAFFATFVLRLCRDYGGVAFNARLWHELGKRPDATSEQDGIDNFILAASAAAGKDLSDLFTTQWRWPISPKAAAVAKKRWKKF